MKRIHRTDGDGGERFALDWRLKKEYKDNPSSKRLFTIVRLYQATSSEISRLSGMVERARGRHPAILAPWLR